MASLELSEDIIDDLLYFARTADVAELQTTVAQVAQEQATTPSNVLLRAKDADSGNTTMHMAAANGYTEIIKLLLALTSNSTISETAVPGALQATSALINIPNNNGNSPLHWAALNGHLEAVKVLVDAGADLLAKNDSGHDVAYEAELAGKEEVVNWLLSAEKDDDSHEKGEEADSSEIAEPPDANTMESAG